MAFNRLSTVAWIFLLLRHTCLRGEDTFFCITYQEVSGLYHKKKPSKDIELSKNKTTFYDVCLIALLPLRERMMNAHAMNHYWYVDWIL